jgi:uncharacterized tellurite resistance protein B-like protein
MLAAIRRFVSELAGSAADATVREDDQRLAAAALLYHVVALDGVVDADERVRLRALLMAEFSLDEDDSEALIDEAAEADREAVDLYGFTSLLKAHLDDEGRRNVIRLMWKMVYADGAVHELEDSILWRVAELLGVSSRDRMLLKKAAQTTG